MIPKKDPQHWDEQSRNKLQMAIGKKLIKFKKDLNKERQQKSIIHLVIMNY